MAKSVGSKFRQQPLKTFHFLGPIINMDYKRGSPCAVALDDGEGQVRDAWILVKTNM
jgi:hypothetical protein